MATSSPFSSSVTMTASGEREAQGIAQVGNSRDLDRIDSGLQRAERGVIHLLDRLSDWVGAFRCRGGHQGAAGRIGTQHGLGLERDCRCGQQRGHIALVQPIDHRVATGFWRLVELLDHELNPLVVLRHSPWPSDFALPSRRRSRF